MSDSKSLKSEIERLSRQPGIPGKGYYRLTRLANDEGLLLQSAHTEWLAFTKSKPQREIREASLLDGPKCREIHYSMGETCLMINHEEDLKFWYAFGGNAVIVEDVAQARLSAEIGPRESATASGAFGFVDVSGLSEAQCQHAPSKKLRMKVLDRDGRRCFICGRSPANYVDVELHVHHIVPWGSGGITEQENLVTLCGTCHGGLDPHFDWGLVFGVKEKYYPESTDYSKQLKNYQKCVRKGMQA
ncbi:HNH endonuclease [Pseudomonas sp. B21-047]|uniref:HNH endonuclease n=1 Tax=Pseudomonas sp. B21-047 TaxID=2895489 RepID=UPI002160F652|nr:HNH endonuclease [Pseudomonas sp. B21-047]UVL05966.1 HNH endonuclease [Pseudomonas sp. B21-047]